MSPPQRAHIAHHRSDWKNPHIRTYRQPIQSRISQSWGNPGIVAGALLPAASGSILALLIPPLECNTPAPLRMQKLPPLPDVDDRFEVRTLADRLLGGFLNPWLNHLLPAGLLRWIVGTSHSPILRETFRCPGGWSSTYLAYEQAPPVDWIDRIVLSDPIARSLRNRRQVVTRKLAEFITQYAADGPVTLPVPEPSFRTPYCGPVCPLDSLMPMSSTCTMTPSALGEPGPGNWDWLT